MEKALGISSLVGGLGGGVVRRILCESLGGIGGVVTASASFNRLIFGDSSIPLLLSVVLLDNPGGSDTIGELLAEAKAFDNAFCSAVMPPPTRLRGIEINGGIASFGKGGSGECTEVEIEAGDLSGICGGG